MENSPTDFAPPLVAEAAATLPALLTETEARAIAGRLRRGVRELDAAYAVPGARNDWGAPLEWSIEPEPLVLEAHVWSGIEAAVQQRARTVNHFLSDIYSGQEVLRQKLVPADLVLGDPFFRRPSVGLGSDRASPATVLRFDLVRVNHGQWMFVDSFANTPVGASFAVQNRRFLTQERGSLFAKLPEFRSVIDFPVRLLQHLKALSLRPTENPTIVLLTAGPGDPNFFEHSFLARKMGLPLAQGADLLVLDDCVYFKTVAGLVPVDVIHRRINDAHADPVVFPTSRLSGVPGLMASIRARRVAVANAIGSGIADNRALEAYMPRLIRYFSGEKPILPGVSTYYCGNLDQLAVVHDDTGGELSLLPAQPSHGDLPSALPGCSPAARIRVLEAIARAPHAYVARTRPPFDTTGGEANRRAPVETRLSCFALCDGRKIEVMPGGLVRLLPSRRTSEPPGWQIGATADVIVLAGEHTAIDAEPPSPPERVRLLTLGSRAAENLFWAGRYAERAESAARILSLIEDVGLEEVSRRERRARFPVWRGVLEGTGQGSAGFTENSAWFTPEVAWRMTLDTRSSNSLIANVRAALDNTIQCRDFFSPETVGVLSRLFETLEQFADRGARDETSRRDSASAAVAAALDGLAAFFGTVDRTMLHDTGWNFFQTGMYLERAVMTVPNVRHVLIEAEIAARDNRREDADLTALVRILSSQDAYRRTYQARAEPLFVAELFLLNRYAPKSIYACALGLRDALEAISSITGAGDDTPVDAIWAILARLDELKLDRFFVQRTDSPRFEPPTPVGERSIDATAPQRTFDGSLAEWLDAIQAQLLGLGSILHDFYFSHQARIAGGDPTGDA